MWEKFFSGEVAVYASTKGEAARFIKAYMDTGWENLSDEWQKDAAQDDIEFSYDFEDRQITWVWGYDKVRAQGWHAQKAELRMEKGYKRNPGAPYKSITVKEFFGDE